MPITDHLQQPVEVFISFAHADKWYLNKLEKSLAALKREGIISITHSGEIEAGKESATELSRFLDRARIILLLISSDFIHSDQCFDLVLARAFERHKSNKVQLIPVIIRSCDWEDTYLGELAVLPEGGRPVSAWHSRDEAFTGIAKAIRSLVVGKSEVGAPKRLRESRGKILKRLPWFCNRTEQDGELSKILSAANHSPHRPFVCIIHGNVNECPEMYEERLQYKTLPKLLGQGTPSALSVSDTFLPFPNGVQNVAHGLNELRRMLSEEFTYKQKATEEEIARAISQFRTPIIIHTYISSENWEPHGQGIVDGFIRYWSAFPDLPPPMHLIICLFVIYRESGAIPPPKAQGEVSRKAREFLDGLDFSAYGGVRGAVLPEMSAIRLADAEDCIRARDFIETCQLHSPRFCNVPVAIEEIRGYYESVGRGDWRVRVPMEDLAKELRKVLEENFC